MGDETAGGTAPPARFPGVPVSAGTAAGILRIVADSAVGDTNVAATPEEVAAAFTGVAAERSALAARLRKAGRTSEAEIIAVGALIAGDPALSSPAVAAVQAGTDAVTAVREAAEHQAAMMEKLDNPALAARAGDIRQVGVAVIARLAAGGGMSTAAAAASGDGAGTGPEADAGSGLDADAGGATSAGADVRSGLDADGGLASNSGGSGSSGDGDFILVRQEVTPSDLIELA